MRINKEVQAINETCNQNRVIYERMEQLKAEKSSARDWIKNNLLTYQD